MNKKNVMPSISLAASIIFFVVSTLVANHILAEENIRENYESIPWDERTWQERLLKGTYEDFYTFKHRKPYDLDPYIWAYTAEFAKHFRMPEKWIDPELKGALAVAWRMTTVGNTGCGLGREENCWPSLTCQMDIYFDSNTPLPWKPGSPMQDNHMSGISSRDFLPSSKYKNYLAGGPWRAALLSGPFIDKGSKSRGGAGRELFYDRQFEPSITLVGFEGCPTDKVGPVIMPFYSHEEYEKTRGWVKNYSHEVEFSKAYITQLNEAYKIRNKPNRDIVERIRNEFFRQKSQPSN